MELGQFLWILDGALVAYMFAIFVRKKGGMRSLGLVLVPAFVFFGWLWNQFPGGLAGVIVGCSIMPGALFLRLYDAIRAKSIDPSGLAQLAILALLSTLSIFVFMNEMNRFGNDWQLFNIQIEDGGVLQNLF